jgi:glycosyltransferase involved in cell wall biosynthesis
MTTGTLVVANWRDSSHPRAGGAELCCEEVASRLAGRGHHVVYLTAAAPGAPAREERAGYTIIRRGHDYGVYPAVLWWLLRHRRSVAGVIDSQNGIPFFAPLVIGRRTPVVMLLHHIHQTQFGHYLPAPAAALARWLERTGCRWVYGERAVAAVSPSTRSGARKTLRLRGSIHVVPLGMERPQERRSGRVPRSATPLVVCVGRMVAHKRHDLIISAFVGVRADHPTARLVMVGDGPERRRLEDLVEAAGIGDAVQFVGALPDEERDATVSRAWVTVSASQGEGWGLSVIEANALGVPAVAFDVPGLRDSVRPGSTGWLVPPGGDLSEAVSAALTAMGGPDADRISEAARRWATNFEWEQTADLLEALLGSERDRLARKRERRRHSDLAMVARVPIDEVPDDWVPALRRSDRVIVADRSVAMLLLGCDTEAATAALWRSGLPAGVVAEATETLEVARAADHVVPAQGTAASDHGADGCVPLQRRGAAEGAG